MPEFCKIDIHGNHGLYAAQFWNYLLQEHVTITEPSTTKLNSV